MTGAGSRGLGFQAGSRVTGVFDAANGVVWLRVSCQEMWTGNPGGRFRSGQEADALSGLLENGIQDGSTGMSDWPGDKRQEHGVKP